MVAPRPQVRGHGSRGGGRDEHHAALFLGPGALERHDPDEPLAHQPAAQIYDQLPTTVDWPALFELKRHWQVSLAALLMRARTLKRMTEGTYRSAIKTASARGWRRVEPVPLGQPEQPTKLLSYLASPDSTATRAVLPSQILESIQTASTA